MRKLSKKEIEQINQNAPYNQGIFKEPFGIPDSEKRLVVYQRWETGGYSGGSCYGDEAEPYTNLAPPPEWTVLDEYYGNKTDYITKYIVLEEIEKFCDEVGHDNNN